MNAHIITIGNELLIGDIVNTNASWIGQKLTEHFINIDYIHTISDDYDRIYLTLKESMKQADIVLMTGGLGPTKDDITKKVAADFFECGMKVHQPTLDHIKAMFKKLNITFSKSNYGQAQVPACCEVLFNEMGTAPGMWFEKGEKVLVAMPGVPSEMKYFMEKKVMPKLISRNREARNTITRYIKTAGVGESTLSDVVLDGIDEIMEEGLQLASLPDNGGVTLRLSAQSNTLRQTQQMIDTVEAFILEKAAPYIYAYNRERTLPEATGKALSDKNMYIATAESCTGGLISAALTDVPGSSAYTLGGIIAYANSVKVEQLGVKERDLEKLGAVSKPVALQMAAGIIEATGADVGISTTGIAGPGGGTTEKPVGTIWMGFKFPDDHFAVCAHLHKDRNYNRKRTVKLVLEIVRRKLAGVDELPYGLEKQRA